MKNNVKNSARFVGEVINKHSTDKVTILTIKTIKEVDGKERINFPKAICFERVKPQADALEVGDYALVDCTIQSNERDRSIANQSMRTIAANHISKVDPNDDRYHSVNAFKFFCRVLSTRKASANVAIARIFFFTNRAHYMTVVFKHSDPETVNAFCALAPNQYVILNGAIETGRYVRKDESVKYTEDCVVRSFRVIERKTNVANAEANENT